MNVRPKGLVSAPHHNGGAWPLAPFAAQPDCLRMVFWVTRTHSPHPVALHSSLARPLVVLFSAQPECFLIVCQCKPLLSGKKGTLIRVDAGHYPRRFIVRLLYTEEDGRAVPEYLCSLTE